MITTPGFYPQYYFVLNSVKTVNGVEIKHTFEKRTGPGMDSYSYQLWAGKIIGSQKKLEGGWNSATIFK